MSKSEVTQTNEGLMFLQYDRRTCEGVPKRMSIGNLRTLEAWSFGKQRAETQDPRNTTLWGHRTPKHGALGTKENENTEP